MDVTLFLAKAIGIWMVSVGIGALRASDTFKTIGKEFTSEKLSWYLGALFAYIIGILIVLTHNVWEFNWPVLITIFGWIGLLKGISLIVFPEEFKKFADWYIEKVNFKIVGAIYGLVGLFLCWKGFGL